MDKNRKYMIKIDGAMVEVSREVYISFYKHKRREKYQVERDAKNGVVSYHTIEYYRQDITGEETIFDKSAPTPEIVAIENMSIEKLKLVLSQLTDEEMELINSVFYLEISVRELSKIWSIPRSTLRSRQEKILQKLRKLLES